MAAIAVPSEAEVEPSAHAGIDRTAHDWFHDAIIYQMHIKASADVAAADITVVDYVGQLTGVAANTLIGTNFV